MPRSILMCALMAFSFAALADGIPICKNNVATLDTEYQAAVAKNDVVTMDRLLSDDYILVTSKGDIYTKADLLQEARSGKIAYTRQDDRQQTVRTWGNTAVITALLTVVGTEEGKPFAYNVWFSDTYVCTSKGWRYVFGQSAGRL